VNDVVVFLGPTLPAAEAPAHLPGATFRGPARLGDVYRACLRKPAALLIIDGVFDQELAVWHKEILWALAHGVRVFGAASMGALRAAELAPFGMVGVGEVFEAYARGELEDDDEVAVAHERAEGRYRPLGEAMVNVRATLKRAEAEGLISAATRERLIAAGKAIFYPQRTLPAILAADPAPGPDSERLAGWLAASPGARVDQKRLDAEAALQKVAVEAPTWNGRPPPPSFHFEYTEAWHEFRRRLS
jgi:hypothetical protein